MWISVNDKLPKKGERVLVVCTNYQNQMQEHVSICEFWGDCHYVCGKVVRKPLWSGHKNVTHWMPLPELPREGER
jgi:hypothetical protein